MTHLTRSENAVGEARNGPVGSCDKTATSRSLTPLTGELRNEPNVRRVDLDRTGQPRGLLGYSGIAFIEENGTGEGRPISEAGSRKKKVIVSRPSDPPS